MHDHTSTAAAALLSALRYDGEVDWQRVEAFKVWLDSYQQSRMRDVVELMKTATPLPEDRIGAYTAAVVATDEWCEFTLTLIIRTGSRFSTAGVRGLFADMSVEISDAMYRLLLAPRKFVVAADGTAELEIEPRRPHRRLSGPAPMFCGQSLN